MRWKSKKSPEFEDILEKTKFLLFPRCINGEWRWWETATIRYEYKKAGYENVVGSEFLRWEAIAWVNE